MADLAITISKAAVDRMLADKARHAGKEEEAEKWQTVRRDLAFIAGESEMVQSFLVTADAERLKSDVVRTWVRQARDLSYDVDDCIEFVLHLDTQPSSSKTTTLWLRLLAPFKSRKALPLQPLDQALAEITQLKARVVDVSHRNMLRRSIIIASRSQPAMKFLHPGRAMGREQGRAVTQGYGLRHLGFQRGRVNSFIEETYHSTMRNYGLLGRDREVDKLLQLTLEHSILLVFGMPGVGKSLLVKAVYHKHRQATEHRASGDFDQFAWVNVSHSFNPMNFSGRLLADLYPDGRADAHRTEDPIDECRGLLREYRCLVVIDGMPSSEHWDWIEDNLMQSGNSGNRIVIISQEESVAKYCVVSKNYAVYNVKGLEAPEASQLFRQVFEQNGFVPPAMGGGAKLILSKCGGIPMLIVTVAEYLTTRPKDVLEQEMRHLSANFMHELETKLEFDSLRRLLAWMSSYLHSGPRHLKPCMLYLSIFPQDMVIRRTRLVRRWIAEGYSKGTDSNSMVEYAEKILNELATQHIILQPALGAMSKVIGYRVNGFFREYVISRPVEETILFPVEVSALVDGHCCLTTEGIVQHLAIGSDWKRNWGVFETFDLSKLRSLTLFRRFRAFYVSDRMRVLRVLDLESAVGVSDSELEYMGKLPPRLKFLSLRGCQRISRLPDSFGDLLHLQSLDIRGTSIDTLPPCITKLQKLQYIRAGRITGRNDDRDQDGPQLPRGFKHLTALQTLGTVNISNLSRNDIVTEFCRLKQLRKLQVSGINQENAFYLRLGLLLGNGHLESLSLCLGATNVLLPWQNNPSSESIRSLSLYGHVEEPLPDIMCLRHLMKLNLDMTTRSTPEVLGAIGGLPSLRTLCLCVKEEHRDQEGEEEKELRFSAGLFSGLQVLHITSQRLSIRRLHMHVVFDNKATQRLELLKADCFNLPLLLRFSGLQHLVCLKQVVLIDHAAGSMFADPLKEALQRQLRIHPMNPALVLEWPGGEEAQRRHLERFESPHHELRHTIFREV